MDTEILELQNGIRCVFHPSSSPITHVCILIGVGSRDEEEGKFGLAHLIEHLLFKKTKKRSTHRILNRLESVGGDLNAYTTKEYTCIHASILNEYLDRALDLLADIIFNSVFPEVEIVKEKEVILDEIASYLDSPEEAIMDELEDIVFSETELGHNILGNEADLDNISREDILQFIKEKYTTDKIVIGISGNYTLAKVNRQFTKHFQAFPSVSSSSRERTTISNLGFVSSYSKPIHQVHFMIGMHAYSQNDPNKIDLLLLNNMLGGMGMSSILNMAIREKHGIAYTIDSNYSVYSDSGVLSIYMGTDAAKLNKAVKLVEKELNKLKMNPVSSFQLEKARKKFKGQIALSEENRLGVVIAECKNVLDYGRIITLEEVFQKLDKVTPQSLLSVANELFVEDNQVFLQYTPEHINSF